jgi:hypothetical protein
MGPGNHLGYRHPDVRPLLALLLVGATIGLFAAGFIWLLVFVCEHLIIGCA